MFFYRGWSWGLTLGDYFLNDYFIERILNWQITLLEEIMYFTEVEVGALPWEIIVWKIIFWESTLLRDYFIDRLFFGEINLLRDWSFERYSVFREM